MAELRRVGGDMESHRRPAGPRHLLPAEIELCKFIGIDEKDYWKFVDSAAKYVAERPEEYAIVPDVRNEPATVSIVLTVVGIALQVAGALLAPKPRAPQQQGDPPQLETATLTGKQRFTPTNNFSSVQELATIGEIVPLVYCRYADAQRNGGVRVSTQLLWSQLESYGSGQQLKAIYLISEGKLGAKPDFEGFAIGDATLENYNRRKVKAYYRNGSEVFNRISKSDAYGQTMLEPDDRTDVFALLNDKSNAYGPLVSGARTPQTQSTFGCYSPVPNGAKYMVPYELVLVYDDDNKEDNEAKKKKIDTEFWTGCLITGGSTSGGVHTVIYRIDGNLYPPDEYEPWGTADVRQSVNGIKISADEALVVGEQYMVGEALAVCTKGKDRLFGSDVSDLANADTVKSKKYEFKLLEGGPNSYDTTERYDVTASPHQKRLIQRVAIGTVTNNRKCNATEIGLKSTVWRQVTSFANMNSHPSESLVKRYEEKNGSITLGQMSTYLNRYSFFTLHARRIRESGASDDGFERIVSKLFAVKGRSPVAQYNWLRITHPGADPTQYEYQFKPYPGNAVYQKLGKGLQIILLSPTEQVLDLKEFTNNNFKVTCEGQIFTLTPNAAQNPEWIKGPPPSASLGRVEQLSLYQQGDIPIAGYKQEEMRINYEVSSGELVIENGVVKIKQPNGGLFTMKWYWDGKEVGTSKEGDDDFKEITVGNIIYRRGEKVEDFGLEVVYQIQRWSFSDNEAEPTEKGREVPIKIRDSNPGTGLSIVTDIWDVDENTAAARWRIKNGGRDYINGPVTLELAQLNSKLQRQQIDLKVDSNYIEASINDFDAISDYWLYDAERSSHADSPEHEIAYVNEIMFNGRDGVATPYYPNMAIAGIRINASSEVSTFSNFSTYVKNGIEVDRLITDAGRARRNPGTFGPTNNFPEVAYDLLTHPRRGANKFVGPLQVDRDKMVVAAQFCHANEFHFDGAITDSKNLRNYIYEMAGYNLLDFTIVGGKFALYPSVPFGTDFKIKYKYKPDIKALFTDGNIKDLKVTFLSPEERQLFRATVIWRQNVLNGFPRTRVYTARLSDAQGGSDVDPEESFDISSFCTSKKMAETFAKVALRLRKYVDHGVVFTTTPQAAMRLTPGDYFRLVSHTTHTSRFDNGSIADDGTIQASTKVVEGQRILYWRAGMEGPRETTLSLNSEGKANSGNVRGSVFTRLTNVSNNRVYKCESLSYADDGLIEVAGTYMELNNAGHLAYLDWSDRDFVDTDA